MRLVTEENTREKNKEKSEGEGGRRRAAGKEKSEGEGVTLRVFLSYFVYPLKIKQK